MAADGFSQVVYETTGKVLVTRSLEPLSYINAIEPIIDKLDTQQGVLLASSFDYPGRYTRWDIGFVNPPLKITAKAQHFSIEALNQRGQQLLPALLTAIQSLATVITDLKTTSTFINGTIKLTEQRFAEELRSKQPSIFSVLRTITHLLASNADNYLGLYGAFGYDLAFQFEPIQLKVPRSPEQRDLVLYLPDEIYVIDHRREVAQLYRYDFEYNGHSTAGLQREGKSQAYQGAQQVERDCDHQLGEYAAGVMAAKEAFRRGDLFEVVPGQTFYRPCPAAPSEIFRRLRERNPSPYGFLMNLGDAEYLVGASPEMYVRVTGQRVETCPISGTIARGENAIGDAKQILTLLSSEKETAELTMCTDVDRNDKSRICVPGSVKVIGRRQIEMYSRLIHTVDHVEGILRDGYDAIDAFLTHTWAVTVTGAPKIWAMQFIENHEHTPRHWYGGAVGFIGFNGNMNTGLTLRTIRIVQGVAQVRAGATLLYDSVPEEEEAETRLKASALLDAVTRPRSTPTAEPTIASIPSHQQRILLVDHQDSFVHTLANYLAQTGCDVVTLRAGFSKSELMAIEPDLIVLSPGPGSPKDFDLNRTIKMALECHLPIFGVCLGLQGIVEYFGGELGILNYPMHGKPSEVQVKGGKLFHGLPSRFRAGRYHSLYAKKDTFPTELTITAETEDGVVMAVEHKTLPVWAVQFHPESILSLDENVGYRIIANVLTLASKK